MTQNPCAPSSGAAARVRLLRFVLCAAIAALPFTLVDGQEDAAAAQTAPAVVELSDTGRMDPDVVALIAEYVAKAKAAPSDADVRAELGMAYEANNMGYEAEACYRDAAALDPSKAEWRYRLGVSLRANGKLDEAVEVMTQVTTEITRTESILVRYAEMLLELGRVADAQAAYERAVTAGVERAQREQEAGTQGPRFYHAHLGLGRVYLQKEEFETALGHLNTALEIAPTAKGVHFTLGQVYMALGREQEGEHHFALGKNAFRDYPPDPHTAKMNTLAAGFGRRMGRIENMLASGDPQQIQNATAELVTLAAERPNNHFVLNLLARSNLMQGNIAKAEEYLRRSAKANSSVYDTYLQLATVMLNQGKLDEALGYADQAVAAAPQLGRPYYVRGLCLLQDQERAQEALNAFIEAQARGCREAQMFFTMSQMYYQMQNARESLKYAKLARDVMPDNPMLHLLCVQAYAGLGKWDDALEALEGAKRVAPEHPQVIGMEKALKESIQKDQQSGN